MSPDLRSLAGSLASLGDAVMAQSPANICQAILVGLGAAILALALLPAAAKKHLFDYGARDTTRAAAAVDKVQGSGSGSGRGKGKSSRPEPLTEPGALEQAIATAVSYLQVPHSWFSGFYVFYLACSTYWAAQWWSWQHGQPGSRAPDSLFGLIVASQQASDLALQPMPATSMALVQVYAALVLEALQACRRLYEHLCVFQPSKAKMNAAHFVLGLMYYAIMSVAVWVEGSQAIMSSVQHDAKFYKLQSVSAFTVHREALAKVTVGTVIFLLAWVGQFRCHVHLAGLRKYSLPEEGLFRYFISPHYTCEVVLYVALSMVTAPEGTIFNQTVLASLLFVLANLGVTADRTKQWYSDKFGAERVAKKWRMIPFVF